MDSSDEEVLLISFELSPGANKKKTWVKEILKKE